MKTARGLVCRWCVSLSRLFLKWYPVIPWDKRWRLLTAHWATHCELNHARPFDAFLDNYASSGWLRSPETSKPKVGKCYYNYCAQMKWTDCYSQTSPSLLVLLKCNNGETVMCSCGWRPNNCTQECSKLSGGDSHSITSKGMPASVSICDCVCLLAFDSMSAKSNCGQVVSAASAKVEYSNRVNRWSLADLAAILIHERSSRYSK